MPDSYQPRVPFTKEQYGNAHGDGLMVASNPGGGYVYPSEYGIRSRFPRSTPKYARLYPRLNHEFVETTARMYIAVSSPKTFIQEVDPALQSIARVLVGSSDKEDSGGRGYIDFLLQQANHQLNEKFQVVETLSDNYVAFFFGQSAPIFQYSGSLMNTFQDDWAINMMRLFQGLGRGSQLARRGVLFYLKYDSMIISGSLLNLNMSLTGDIEIVVPFSFNLLVRKIYYIYGSLEPPTDIMTDDTVRGLPKELTAFDPSLAIYQSLEEKKIQGRVDDDMGGETPMGISAAAQPQDNKPTGDEDVKEPATGDKDNPTSPAPTVKPMKKVDEAMENGQMGQAIATGNAAAFEDIFF